MRFIMYVFAGIAVLFILAMYLGLATGLFEPY